MKKWFSVLLALMLALLCCAGLAEGTTPQTVDFENGAGAFIQSGSCALSVSTEQKHGGSASLLVHDRTVNNWDAADLDAAAAGIAAGAPVTLSAWVYVDSAEDGSFAIGKAGGDYAYLAQADVKGRTWTELKASFTLDTLVNLRFLTASDNYIGVSYYLDDVALTVGAAPEAEVSTGPALDYASDFSSGTDGWYARSAGGATVEVTADGLYTTGRTATWNSPGRDFELLLGHSYNLSVLVKQDELDSTGFILSVAHTRDGEESYENLATCTAKKGEWTMMSCTYTAGRYDKFVLYVEGGAADTSYTIKDFKCFEKVDTFGVADLPSLKELYADKFDVGTAVTGREVLETKRMDFYKTQFAIITAGNEMKPDSLLDMAECRRLSRTDDTAVAVHFDNAIPMLDWCRDNGVKVHGHVLVWHSQTPEAFFHEGYATHKPLVSREVMLARMESYIRQVLTWTNENYPGLIVSWDVVNEAVADGSDKLRESNWTKVVGQDFVNRAFEYARKYAAEGTLLFYNDYNTPIAPKTHGILTLLDSLLADGTVDGYGFQAHYSANSPDISRVAFAFQQVAQRPLLIRVSELDVGIKDTSDANLRRQARYYRQLFDIFEEYADKVIAVQVWGTTDDLSWRADEYPTLFDDKAQPKYAFWALTDPSKIPAEE